MGGTYTNWPNCKLVTDVGLYFVFTEANTINVRAGFMRILTYHEGLPPKGKKTNWITEEFSHNPAIILASQPGAETRAEEPDARTQPKVT